MRGWDGESPGEGRESACRMCETMELRSAQDPDEGKWMCATGDSLPRSSLGTQCTQSPPFPPASLQSSGTVHPASAPSHT